MKRRTLLVAAGMTAALAGCLDEGARSPNGENGEESTPSRTGSPNRFDSEPTRPECEQNPETITVGRGDETQEVEAVGTIPYPDAPASFGNEAVAEYAKSFEEAYIRHDAICGNSYDIIGFAYTVEKREVLEWDGEATAVYLYYAGGATGGVDERGEEWAADLGFTGVIYGIDKTGVVRSDLDGAQRREPDVLATQMSDLLDDGGLVASFE